MMNPTTADTVELIERLAVDAASSPTVQQAAAGIRQRLSSSPTDLELVRLVELYVSEVMAYRDDPPGIELVKDPAWALQLVSRYGQTEGDCDDAVALVSALLIKLGYRPQLVRLAWFDDGADPYAHVLVQVPIEVEGRVTPVLLDTTVSGDLGSILDRAARVYVHSPML